MVETRISWVVEGLTGNKNGDRIKEKGENGMANFSDGKKDGLVMFYLKNGKIYPIAFTEEQLELVDSMVGVAIGASEKPLRVIFDTPVKTVGLVGNMKED